MRLRTTWNREALAKLAAASKKAEDPRAMNQDHHSQQPSAEKYVIGDPSDFAEDVHPSNGTWKAEYSGDEVKRNEIGMPEMRGDTFKHPEKTAADDQGEDEELLEKKAEVCIDIATRMLSKTASEQMIEDQALALMHLPNSVLIETANRMAADEDQEDEQAKEAGDMPPWLKDKVDDKDGDKDQEKKEAGQIPEALKDHQFKKEDGGDKDKDQEKKEAAGQVPENFKKDQDEPAKDQEQKKEAQDQMAAYSLQARQALQQGNVKLAQEMVQQMAQLQQAPQAAPQEMMSQEQAEQQIQQMFQQALGQGQQQQAPMGDDQLLDQMLTAGDDMITASGNELDIELESNNLDTGSVHLGSDDEALKALFASHEEVRNQLSLTGETYGSAPAPMARTASTRTVGTRPSAGVSSIGGGMSESSGSNDIEKLSGLWQSAPDVKKVFNP